MEIITEVEKKKLTFVNNFEFFLNILIIFNY